MIEFSNNIDTFDTITLEKLNEYNYFSDRNDRKYIIPLHLLPLVLKNCRENYLALEINNKKIFNYKTIYFDTPNLTTYHQHHRGKATRYKIRKREYADTKESYFEIKFSNQKGKTNKIRTAGHELIEAEQFIKENTPYSVFDLSPILKIEYQRMTLLHKKTNEKITIDCFFNCSNNNASKAFNNLVFIEVKTNSQKEIVFFNIMKTLRIKPGSLSKYCLGVTILINSIKKNNFKPQLNTIAKKELYDNIKCI